MQGHSSGETWGLDVTPEGIVLTSGDDNKVFAFDSKVDKIIGSGILNK
jgi:hypothetical protein